jgi:hypothetical protein
VPKSAMNKCEYEVAQQALRSPEELRTSLAYDGHESARPRGVASRMVLAKIKGNVVLENAIWWS